MRIKNKIEYHKIFISLIERKSKITYKQESNSSDIIILNLRVNGKDISQGEGINEKSVKYDA